MWFLWYEKLKAKLNKRYGARTVIHATALLAVTALFFWCTSAGILKQTPTVDAPSEYLSLSSTNWLAAKSLISDANGHVTEIILFADTKRVVLLRAGLDDQLMVAAADIDEVRQVAAAAKIPIKTEHSVKYLPGSFFSAVTVFWWITAIPILLWAGYFLFAKRDGGEFPSRVVHLYEMFCLIIVQSQARSGWTKPKFHSALFAVAVFLFVIVSAARLYNSSPERQVPAEYNAKKVFAWQLEEFAAQHPKMIERAVVIKEAGAVYTVIYPTGSRIDSLGGSASPEERLTVFNNQAQQDAFLQALESFKVPIKVVAPSVQTGWLATLNGWRFALWIISILAYVAWLVAICEHWDQWTAETAPRLNEDGKARLGRMRIISGTDDDVVGVSGDNRKTLDDVQGCDEAVEQFRTIAGWMRDARVYKAFNAKLPRGVLLIGPPGTGKTLLARALAGEVNGNFFTVSASEFVEVWVGLGAKRVRERFKKAKAAARRTGKPTILFIDEIDAVGKKRSDGGSGGEQERDQTLNQMLTEMQGFDPENGCLVISATNRAETLDEALVRSGRFDYKVSVGRPDKKGRAKIFGVYLKDRVLESDVNLDSLCDELSRRCPDFVGADIELAVNNGATNAAKRAAAQLGGEVNEKTLEALPKTLCRQDLYAGIDKVKFGERLKSKVRTDKERRTTSVHEAGHAGADPEKVVNITIAMTDKTLGMVESHADDQYEWKHDQFLAHIVTLLAGRAAEELLADSISTGASNDFERASCLARQMVGKYGMSDKLGPISLPLNNDGFPTSFIGEAMMSEFTVEWRRIVKECDEKARAMVTANRDRLERVAAVLFEEETITGDRFRQLWNGTTLVEVKQEEVDAIA
ncbi:MAG TPA: AAA family ATPase [Planktothrix sp.]|jgi:ATP-dependent metalloprotease FtsH